MDRKHIVHKCMNTINSYELATKLPKHKIVTYCHENNWENKRGKGLRKCCRTETYLRASLLKMLGEQMLAVHHSFRMGWLQIRQKVKERPKVNENI